MIGQDLDVSEEYFIKALQEMEKHAAAGVECIHRIEIGMSVSLKDSKANPN
jgi:hypothetical protein